MLPSYIGILRSHYKDPYEPIGIIKNVIRVLNVALLGDICLALFSSN